MEYGWNLPKNDGEKGSRIFFLKFLHVQAIFYFMNLPNRKKEFRSKVKIQ